MCNDNKSVLKGQKTMTSDSKSFAFFEIVNVIS